MGFARTEIKCTWCMFMTWVLHRFVGWDSDRYLSILEAEAEVTEAAQASTASKTLVRSEQCLEE